MGKTFQLQKKRLAFSRRKLHIFHNYGKKFGFLLDTFQAQGGYVVFFSHVAGSAQESLFASRKAETASGLPNEHLFAILARRALSEMKQRRKRLQS